jgi:hypothetical protein
VIIADRLRILRSIAGPASASQMPCWGDQTPSYSHHRHRRRRESCSGPATDAISGNSSWQPVKQWYFHRPLSMILQPFFERGLVLDGLDEPLVDPDRAQSRTPGYVYTELPGMPVGRMRRIGGELPP